MAVAVLLAIGLFISRSQSQFCGPGGVFPGLLGFENGPFGAGLPLGLSQSVGAAGLGQVVPPCRQAPPCGIQAPPCGLQVPPCGIQVPPCNLAPISNTAPITNQPCGQCASPCGLPSSGIISPSCGVSVPPCGLQVPSCGLQLPSYDVQVPPYGLQIPPCGLQIPPCGLQVPPCEVQVPIVNNIVPNLIPNQPCSQCSSFIPNQCGACSTFGPTLAPIVPTCDYVQGPMTVVDNTLANSLANALQLLIVSNLLESTLNTPCFNSPIGETVNPYCGNIIEVTPDYYPCNQVVTCEPYVEIPCYQGVNTPCLEVNSIPFDNNFNSYGNNFGCSDMYGLVNPFANGLGCADSLVNPFANGLGCADSLVNPFANGFGCADSLVNPFANGFGCADNLVNPFANGFGCADSSLVNPYVNCGCLNSVLSPVAAEVLFPAEIPAQLTCNFGYMPNNVPCVSMNVEALPFDSFNCNNGVFY